MKLALEVAAVAYREGELPVGCVYADAYTGKVITAAANRTNASYNATTHAELVAINSLLHGQADPAAAAAIFRRCVLYVTLEPCIMCASAVAKAGVLRVVYGAGNDKFGGCGSVLCLHQAQGLAADSCYYKYSSRGGVLRGQAVELLRRFYCQRNVRAPKPRRRRNKGTKGQGPPPLPPGGVSYLKVSAAAAAASEGRSHVPASAPVARPEADVANASVDASAILRLMSPMAGKRPRDGKDTPLAAVCSSNRGAAGGEQ
jgi:tRNA(Arg) A34 adenosine deaminase TadA